MSFIPLARAISGLRGDTDDLSARAIALLLNALSIGRVVRSCSHHSGAHRHSSAQRLGARIWAP